MKPPLTILRIAIPSPLRRSFDYLPPENCDPQLFVPGVRVLVPFGKTKQKVGLLLECSDSSQVALNKLKPVIEILDETPLLSPTLMKLCVWASDYYHHPIGDVMLGALPTGLRKGNPLKTPRSLELCASESDVIPSLNPQQQVAVDAVIQNKGFQGFVLDGVTGSGKTEVYLRIIDAVLQKGQQALVLVPEIGLTPQTVSRFQKRFPVPIAVLHSKLTDRQKLDAWQAAKAGDASIVIGTRSALFTPFPQLGVIILDESHDMSFKQQSGFRYSANSMAMVLGKTLDIPVILGSATPSLESLYNSKKQRYQRLELPERAGNAIHPSFHVIDLRTQRLEEGLSPALLQAMTQHLQNDGQVLLFLNRRGFAPTLLCHQCGWIAGCHRCDARMTLHQSPRHLHCHHCDSSRSVDRQCPSCMSDQLLPLGLGTERLENVLNRHFPDTGLVRMDSDTTRLKGSMQKILDDIHQGDVRILIGTQMLAKGHHFPNVTMVAILDADNGLFSADFRASEHLAQQIVQVAGRAGRAEKPGEVYIQTHNPTHPLLLRLIQEGYHSFAKTSLEEREATRLPPYSYMALIRADAVKQTHPQEFLDAVRKEAEKLFPQQVEILGPIASPMARRAGRYRAQLLLQSQQRRSLHTLLKPLTQCMETLKSGRQVRWSVDVDPAEMY